MQIALDYDDLSCLNHRFDLVEKLRARYPNFKVTFFTVPWEIRLSPNTKGTPITEPEYQDFVIAVRNAVDEGWMNIAIHGLTHAPEEFHKLSYDEAKKRVIVGMKMFENVGIKTNGMFKAPQWLLNEDAKKAIEDLGVTVVEDGYYNWNLKDEMPEEKILIAHGHVQDERATMNGMDQSLVRLMKVPKDAKWVHLADIYDDIRTKTH